MERSSLYAQHMIHFKVILRLTPFSVYVALSRGPGRDNIRLSQDFDEKLMMFHPREHLRVEDERLTRLDVELEKWWSKDVEIWRRTY